MWKSPNPTAYNRVALLQWAIDVYGAAHAKINESRERRNLKPQPYPASFGVKVSRDFEKLGGALVGVYNQTAGLSCVAYTKACLTDCYAGADWFINGTWKSDASRFIFPSGAARHAQNLIAWLEDPEKWETDLCRQLCVLQLEGIKYFRINGAGDLLPGQAEAWLRLVKRHPRLFFWAYTRTWADPDMMPGLLALKAEPNFSLLASVDRVNVNLWIDRGMPLEVATVLVNEDKDYQYIMGKLHKAGLTNPRQAILFQDHKLRKPKLSRNFFTINGTRFTTCPKDRAANKSARVPVTCITCRLCIDRAPRPERIRV